MEHRTGLWQWEEVLKPAPCLTLQWENSFDWVRRLISDRSAGGKSCKPRMTVAKRVNGKELLLCWQLQLERQQRALECCPLQATYIYCSHKKEIGRSGKWKQLRYVPIDRMGLPLSAHTLGVAKVAKNAALLLIKKVLWYGLLLLE